MLNLLGSRTRVELALCAILQDRVRLQGGAYQCIQGPTQTCLHNHRRLLQLIETIRHRGTEPRHDKRPFKGVAPNPAPVPPLPSSVSAVPAAQTVSEGTPAAALMKDPSQSPNANAIQDLSPTARSPASTPSDKSTAPTAPPGPSPAKPPASTPLPAPAESPSKAPDPNQTSSPALPPAPSTSAAPGPAPAGVLMVAPSPAPAPVPQKCPEGCQKGRRTWPVVCTAAVHAPDQLKMTP